MIIRVGHITPRLTFVSAAVAEELTELTHAVIQLTEGQNELIISYEALEKLLKDELRPKVTEIHQMLTTLSATRAATSAAIHRIPSAPLFPSASATASTSSVASSVGAPSSVASSVHLGMPKLSLTDSQPVDVPSGSGPPAKSGAAKGKAAGTLYHMIQYYNTDSH